MSKRYTPDKLTFLLSLVPYLSELEVVSVAEVAEHFQLSQREVIEAVELIAVSGVPSEDGFVFHNDMFDIDWDAFENEREIVLTNQVAIDEAPRFSRAELTALIAGVQYLAGVTSDTLNLELTRLQSKLAQLAGATVGTAGETLQLQPAQGASARELIRQAIESKTQLRFDYSTAEGRTERRQVDPVQLESDNDTWYMRAWCHSRRAIRVFRLDRMTALEASGEAADTSHDHITLPDTLFEAGASDFDVTVEVSRSALPLLGDYLRSASIPPSGDPVTVEIRVAHVHGLKRVIAEHAGLMRVIAPAGAAAAVRDWLAAGLANYDHTTAPPPVV